MFTTLGPEAIGIRGLTLPEAIALARRSGFAGVTFSIREAAQFAAEHGEDNLRGLFASAGVRPANWGVPVDWGHDERWQAGLRDLPRFAALGRALDCPRAITVVWPGSDDRAYADNLAWHVARLRPVAAALAEAGCRLGLEFIGPKTFRAQYRHEFLSTLGGALGLAREIGTGNVGLLLDAWHLYTSGGTAADLDGLTNDQIVAVHVNDAPAGIPVDEQIDTQRALPLETGVIAMADFMANLRQMGYDGPVMPEPFSQRLDALAAADPEAAAREAARSMAALWELAGLA